MSICDTLFHKLIIIKYSIIFVKEGGNEINTFSLTWGVLASNREEYLSKHCPKTSCYLTFTNPLIYT